MINLQTSVTFINILTWETTNLLNRRLAIWGKSMGWPSWKSYRLPVA